MLCWFQLSTVLLVYLLVSSSSQSLALWHMKLARTSRMWSLRVGSVASNRSFISTFMTSFKKMPLYIYIQNGVWIALNSEFLFRRQHKRWSYMITVKQHYLVTFCVRLKTFPVKDYTWPLSNSNHFIIQPHLHLFVRLWVKLSLVKSQRKKTKDKTGFS